MAQTVAKLVRGYLQSVLEVGIIARVDIDMAPGIAVWLELDVVLPALVAAKFHALVSGRYVSAVLYDAINIRPLTLQARCSRDGSH